MKPEKNIKVYTSLTEWKKAYLPTSVADERIKDLSNTPECLGVTLAHESLEEVTKILTKV